MINPEIGKSKWVRQKKYHNVEFLFFPFKRSKNKNTAEIFELFSKRYRDVHKFGKKKKNAENKKYEKCY
jgi:hypothetical protein